MRLVSRQQWGAKPPRTRTGLNKGEQRGTAVHYSGANADELGNHNLCPARVHGIQRFHQEGRGWADIAYSFLVCKHGFVFEGRGLGIRTAANGTNSGNDGYHAVCFLGDDTAGRDDVTGEGRAALADVIGHCNAWAGVSEVRPHSSFKATGCPGDELRAWIARGVPVSPAAPSEELSMADVKQLREDIAAVKKKVEATFNHVSTRTGDVFNEAHAARAEVAELRKMFEAFLLQQGGSDTPPGGVP